MVCTVTGRATGATGYYRRALFAFRNVQYAHATMFITLLVLLCFNLLGEGFEVALPRVIDTLIGCAIAWAAVSYIWPDWKFRNLPRMLERATEANCRYLDAILEQYHQGRDNRLAYRIARRDAHNRDAELASVVSNMSSEPNVTPQIREAAFRLLCLNHTFTSYISALGAHREQLTNPEILAFLDDAVCYVDDALHHQPADEERVNQALAGLKQRMQQLEPSGRQQRTSGRTTSWVIDCITARDWSSATPDYSSSAGNSCFGVRESAHSASSWRRATGSAAS